MKSLPRILLSSLAGATSTVMAAALVSVFLIITTQGSNRSNIIDDSPERGAIALALFGGPLLGALTFLATLIVGFMATHLQWRKANVIRYSLALAVIPSAALVLLFAPLANAIVGIEIGATIYLVWSAGIFAWWSVLRVALTGSKSPVQNAPL